MMRFFYVLTSVVLGWCLLSRIAHGATTPNSVISPQTPKITITQFIQGTDAAGTYKTIYTGGTNGSKILGIWATSTDGSAAHVVSVAISSSTSSHCATPATSTSCSPLTAVSVAPNSGYSAGAYALPLLTSIATPGVPIDTDGNFFLFLTDSTWTLEATFATALTSTTKLSITVLAADF